MSEQNADYERQVTALTATLAWAWDDLIGSQLQPMPPSVIRKLAAFLVDHGVQIDSAGSEEA